MKILGTGLNGLVGSRVTELLSGEFEFENISLETGVDITDSEKITGIISKSRADWIFHFAAFTDIDGAELDKKYGAEGKVWQINSGATKVIADICRKKNKRLLYISTDFVFAGDKDCYTEDDQPDPQGWYGITKYEGEKHVASLGNNGLIIRIANPYRSVWPGKADFVHRILSRLKEGKEVSAPSDQIFVPTFIDDIAMAINKLVQGNAAGIFHTVGSQAMTPYECALEIAGKYGINKPNIDKTTYLHFWKNRAPRPFHANLTNDKIAKYGVRMKPLSEGLQEILSQGG